MKIKFPIQVADTISSRIKVHPDFTKNTKLQPKAIAICCNLWYYIYHKQQNDINNEDMVNITSLNYYTHIHHDELYEYRLYFIGKHHNYKYFLNLMVEWDLIKINDSYSVYFSYTKSYKINPKIIWGGFTDVEIDFEHIIKDAKNKEYWLKLYPKHKHLIENCYRTTINIEKYTKFLLENKGKTLIKKRVKTITNKKGDKYPSLENRIIDDGFIMECLYNAIKINSGFMWFKVTPEGRFYSSITNLTHTASIFLRISKYIVFEVDIKNCQPLLLGLILNNKQFKLDTQQGIFYDKLVVEIFKITENDILFESKRNDIKRWCYRYIFFNNKAIKTGKLMAAIDKLYSGLVEEINDLKATSKLDSVLQKLEADIIIGGLSYLPFPLITKHDAVFVAKENIDDVKEYLNTHFAAMGSALQLKDSLIYKSIFI